MKAVTWGGTGRATALYTAGLDSQIIAWDLTATPRLMHVSPGAVPLPQAFYVARFGDHMVGTSSEPPYGRSNTTLFDLDLRTGAVHTWGLGFTDVDAVSRVSASADGTRAVISYEDLGDSTFHFLVWDLRTGRRVGTFDPPAGADQSGFLGAVLTSDGTRAYETVSHDRVDLVAAPSGRVLHSAVLRFPGLPLADSQDDPLVVDPSGRLLVGGQQANPPPPPALGTGPVAAPPRPRSCRRSCAWAAPHPTSAPAQHRLHGDSRDLEMAYSPDGATIAFATATGTVTVADAATLRPRPGADSIAASDGAVQEHRHLTGRDDDRHRHRGGRAHPVGRRQHAPGRQPGLHPGLAGMWAWFAASGDVLGVTTEPSTGSPDPAIAHTFTFVARPASWAQRACSLAGTDMSQQAWARYLGSRPVPGGLSADLAVG